MEKGIIGVFGGGGALGAYTCGLLYGHQTEFKFCIGTSTGSLLAALAICGKYEELKEAYCSISPDKIFDKNPFNKQGKIKKINAINKLFVKDRPGLAKATGLEKLIRENYTEEDHNKLQRDGKGFIVTACLISKMPGRTVYFDSRVTDYETMTLAILASCSVPGIFEPVLIKGEYYVDGGVTEPVPIAKAQQMFPQDDIHIYIHQAKDSMKESKDITINSIFPVAGVTLSTMMDEINKGDMKNKKRADKLHALPYQLSNNSLIFDQETMENWFKMGLSQSYEEQGK